MKILKQVSSGLILDTQFEAGILAPLRNQANVSYSAEGVILHGGSILLDTFPFPELVMEVKNTFVPQKEGQLGGLSVRRGSEVRQFFEYYTPDMETIPYLRLHKKNDIYYGFGSNDGQAWSDKGYVAFKDADSIAVTVQGGADYVLNRLSVYTGTAVTIRGLLPGQVVKAGAVEVTAVTDEAQLVLNYPFTGQVEVRSSGELVGSSNLSNAWGGDIYFLTLDISIKTKDGLPIEDDMARYLGNLVGGNIVTGFRIENHSSEQITVSLSISPATEFANWVVLAAADLDYKPELTLTVPGSGTAEFWMKVSRPASGDYNGFDFKKNQCIFWLEVK